MPYCRFSTQFNCKKERLLDCPGENQDIAKQDQNNCKMRIS